MAINAYLLDELFRQSWVGPHGADALAQVIYTILSAQDTTITGPLTISPNPDTPGNSTPPITITLPTGGDGGAITINQGGETTGTISGTGTSGGSAGTIIALFPPATTDNSTLAPFVLLGQIVSGGPGPTYTCLVFPYGPNGSTYTVTANQIQIASDETLPSGMWVPVMAYPYKTGSVVQASYVIFAPVYMSDV